MAKPKKKKMALKKKNISVTYDYDQFNDTGFSEGVTMSGGVYDMGSFGQLNFDYDTDLREKYPALKDAWEHYNNVKDMCEAKEQEDEN